MANAATAPPPDPKLSACCISHEFYKAASKSPKKIAVIHTSGGAKLIAREFHNYSDAEHGAVVSDNELMGPEATSFQYSSVPPVYEGDQCFTFSEILSAVNSLSSRLRRILDGADDPNLGKPQQCSEPQKELLVNEQISDPVESSHTSIRQLTDFKDKYTLKLVGIYMEPSVEYIVAVLSVLRCGEAFVPLDPSWPKERILSIVSSSRADLIMGCEYSVGDNYFHQLDRLCWLIDSGNCPVLSISMKFGSEDQSKLSPLVWPCESEVPKLFCYLTYTSGSTGKPKGICGTESGVLNRFLWMQELYPLHGEEQLVFKTSISFIDHLQEFLGSLLMSCTLIIPPLNELKGNLFYIVDFLEMYSVNRLIAVPSLMKAVVPALQSPMHTRLKSCLKLLILSGEVLDLSLCERLLKLLPHTTVLNLYGSTEACNVVIKVSGDCTYFDCKRLPLILEKKTLASVPIGLPISNCNVVLVGENAPNHGEIYVRGLCLAAGYFDYPSIMPLDCVVLPEEACTAYPCGATNIQYYFKTGDFARQLQSGDLIFIGRVDRTIKFNGQRIALEEIENTFREHPDVFDAAVICRKDHGETYQIEAHVVLKHMDECNETFKSSLRRWIVNKLPQAMVPSHIFFTESLPISSSGKVDYNLLATSSCPMPHEENGVGKIWDRDLMQNLKKDLGSEEYLLFESKLLIASYFCWPDNTNSNNKIYHLLLLEEVFCDALMVDKISIHDNFFEMGGNSISAAYVSYNLGINMKLLYTFPTPLKLQAALQRKIGSSTVHSVVHSGATDANATSLLGSKRHRRSYEALSCSTSDNPVQFTRGNSNDNPVKFTKRNMDGGLKYSCFWDSVSLHMTCSFMRCNNTIRVGKCEGKNLSQTFRCQHISRERKGFLQELWKVHMESCVDASPLVVLKESNAYLFIGSHSQKFACVDVKSGSVLWDIKLEGRIECSAAIVDNFSQVVVGCYHGNIYFLHFSDGSICWKFQTHGEVKSQPVVDKCRHLIWCGSYDHNLYALDYQNYCCLYRLSCGGSIFGSPAIDEMHEKLFVASTSGRVTAISLKALSFHRLWIQELEMPVFGSLSINSANGNVICCLVDGNVVALDTAGSIIWKASTGGPIFAGPCISHSLPSQVLVCSRNGNIYSFELEKGNLLWQHAVGHPITSSAFVDENMEFASDVPNLSDRLVCVCTSSGSIRVLRVNLDAIEGMNQNGKLKVQEFARLDLEGDIFSSPIMIGGKIFVGSRDDFVYCIGMVCNASG